MANKKISALTAATTPLVGTSVLPIVQSGVTKQVSVSNLTVGRAVDTAGGTFTDNQIQGTAAKGINFTANTPAAGMTSQLLNWYEEGTWTPVLTTASGSITTYTATGKYTRVGRIVTAGFDLSITDNGTGGGLLYMTLPVATVSGTAAGGTAIEYAATGNIIAVIATSSTNIAYLVANAGVYPGGTGYSIRGSITYQT
jgi:hypothetical protein